MLFPFISITMFGRGSEFGLERFAILELIADIKLMRCRYECNRVSGDLRVAVGKRSATHGSRSTKIATAASAAIPLCRHYAACGCCAIAPGVPLSLHPR